MPNLDNFLGTAGKADTFANATFNDQATVALRIAQRSTSITVRRAGANLAAQTVRIDIDDSNANDQTGTGSNVQVSMQYVIITGYKNHATITDTNLQRDDRFEYGGQTYTVIDVLPNFSDRLMARARVTG